ncbi:MAG: hypothetical protein J6R18_04895 [Kiritimatiellae bacterium]|nr:hypothetical protein [Kiritimatiellia bacterium]
MITDPSYARQFGRNAGMPVPVLQEENGRFFARWSKDDDLMRSKNRSILERLERIESVDDAFLDALRCDDPEVRWGDRDEIADLARRLSAWRLVSAADRNACAKVVFRIVPPSVPKKRRNHNDIPEMPWRLEISLISRTADVLQALGKACLFYEPLRGITGSSMELEQSEAEAFIRIGAPALANAGYSLEIPEDLAADVVAEAEMIAGKHSGEMRPTSKVKAKITVKVAGEKVSSADIAFLLDQESSIVFFRGRWIEVDRAVLKNALKVLDADGKKMSEREAMSFALGLRRARGLAATRIKGTGWLGKILDELKSGESFKVLSKPKGFKGSLRSYQLRGYSWMKHLTDRGFGALLADDMGLGKTIQTIAWLLKRREKCGAKPALVVSPVSVTMNWVREIEKFAPSMRYVLHQGKDRLTGASFLRSLKGIDVVVTGYPLFVKDFRLLADAGFDVLVLDEAQLIKNPDTRMAQTARAFPCVDRIALTGTPFENRVTDIWSIQEFLNAGLLGSRSEFVDDFERPIREGGACLAMAELKKVLAPFLLRRLKNDPNIAAELGAKREIREYCILAPRQRAAYEVALARYANAPHDERGEKGRALALLTELKLICDGLGTDGEVYGGKVDRLLELLESIFEAGESVLVFSQYVKVAEKLKALIEEKFARKVPFLHGGLTPQARENQIKAFNESKQPTAFILSLKAGGFGLNLTKATHVIHYDRWWNPAVENQATDRAHRIGQAKTVFVHLFISHGTLEDRIDKILEDKRTIAGELVVSGESFLLKMSDKEFARTVSLS